MQRGRGTRFGDLVNVHPVSLTRVVRESHPVVAPRICLGKLDIFVTDSGRRCEARMGTGRVLYNPERIGPLALKIAM
jgi:hypothetical protein